MESESSVCVNDDTTTSAWTSATNWTSVRGTLVNSITFDSSLSPSPIDDETAHLNPTAKRRPLILKPTSPDSGPCELTSESSSMSFPICLWIFVCRLKLDFYIYYLIGVVCLDFR